MPYLWAKLKNGQHHHGKLKFDVGLTYLAFSLEEPGMLCFFTGNTLTVPSRAKAAQ